MRARTGRLGDRVAVRTSAGALTFEELWAEAERTAASLRAEGIGPDDTVGLLLPNSPRFLIALLALCRLDATVALLSPQYGPGELAAIANGVPLTTIVAELPEATRRGRAHGHGRRLRRARPRARGRHRRGSRRCAAEVQLGLDRRAEGHRAHGGQRDRGGRDHRHDARPRPGPDRPGRGAALPQLRLRSRRAHDAPGRYDAAARGRVRAAPDAGRPRRCGHRSVPRRAGSVPGVSRRPPLLHARPHRCPLAPLLHRATRAGDDHGVPRALRYGHLPALRELGDRRRHDPRPEPRCWIARTRWAGR